MPKVRVAIIFGGRSSEHSISCVSAGSVLAALDPERFDAVAIGIAADGRWVLPTQGQKLAISGGRLPAVDGAGLALTLPADPAGARAALGDVDVVFPLLHGPFGEDGTIQGLLELAGVPYVGSGVFASAAAMDKHHMKQVLMAAGLPVPSYLVVRPGRPLPAEVTDLSWPVFVKPARGGSSIGISKVSDVSRLEAAVVAAQQHDPKVLIESGVSGREIECGVLSGPEGPRSSVPAEILLVGDHDFYDFQAKYLDGATSFAIPPDLPEDIIERVRAMAIDAFEALDCEGLARVDFFVTADGGIFVNEVNTMPGFTPTSMFPRMWAAAGVDYADLVSHLIDDALRRGTGLR